MSGHTPGPWGQRTLMVVAPDGSRICHTGGTRYQDSTPMPHETEANARLISAAPELLKALKDITHGLPALLESIGYSDEEGLVEAGLAAIDKAEGND